MKDLLNKLQVNPKNPRIIKDKEFERLKKKIKDFPEMLEKRPIVYDEKFIVLGGNQRLEAIRELVKNGFEIKDSYFTSAKGWTEDQKKNFIINDNISDGEWSWEELANQYEAPELEEWGMSLPELNKTLGEIDTSELIDEEHKVICPRCKFEFEYEL